ncbi:MAG: trehalase family glycosidase [Spirosomataceae bacterium]
MFKPLFPHKTSLFTLGLSILAFSSCQDAVTIQEYISPDEKFPGLFEDIQKSSFFPTDYHFAHAIPRAEAKDILAIYDVEKVKPGFSLDTFLTKSFELPNPFVSFPKPKTNENVSEFAPRLWSQLLVKPSTNKGSLIPYRKPYIVTNGLTNEATYLDNFFLMQGLFAAQKDSLAENIVINTAQFIHDFGYVPLGNRSYYLQRSQLPFFANMVETLAQKKKDDQVYARALTQLQKEYQFWISAVDKEEIDAQNKARKAGEKTFKKVVFFANDLQLSRYAPSTPKPRPEQYKKDLELAKRWGNKAENGFISIRAQEESGWENSVRWTSPQQPLPTPTDFVPVDLNALLYQLEVTLAKAYTATDQPYYAESMKNLAEKRKKAFANYLWNNEKGFFMDYHVPTKKSAEQLTLAGVFPLYVGLATQAQADRVAQTIEQQLFTSSGLILAPNEQTISPKRLAEWHWITIQALQKYGHQKLAEEIRKRYLTTFAAMYQAKETFFSEDKRADIVPMLAVWMALQK